VPVARVAATVCWSGACGRRPIRFTATKGRGSCYRSWIPPSSLSTVRRWVHILRWRLFPISPQSTSTLAFLLLLSKLQTTAGWEIMPTLHTNDYMLVLWKLYQQWWTSLWKSLQPRPVKWFVYWHACFSGLLAGDVESGHHGSPGLSPGGQRLPLDGRGKNSQLLWTPGSRPGLHHHG